MDNLPFDIQEFQYLRDVKKLSLKVIADMLGVSTWRKMQYAIKKNGIEYQFKKAVGGSQERYCKLDRIAYENGYRDFEHLLAENRPTKSQKEIAELFGVSLRSVAHRTPDGIKGWYRHFTDEAKQRQLDGSEKGRNNVDRENHWWKKTW